MKRIRVFAALMVLACAVPSYAQDTKGTKPAATQPVAKVAVKTAALEVVGNVPKADAPAATIATAATGQKWWQNLLMLIISAVLTIATPILSVLAMALIKKWNLKIEQSKVDWVLEKAIGAGEQYAKNRLKAGQPVEGSEIKKVALEHANTLAAKYAPKLGSYLSDLIEAKLGQKLVEAGGAKAAVNGAAKPA